VADDAQNSSGRAVATEAPLAPFAGAARQIDLADNTLPNQGRVVGFDHFADKLVAGTAAEAVVAASQFNICIADAASEQADEGNARRSWWHGSVSQPYLPIFKMYGYHLALLVSRLAPGQVGTRRA